MLQIAQYMYLLLNKYIDRGKRCILQNNTMLNKETQAEKRGALLIAQYSVNTFTDWERGYIDSRTI